MRKLLLFAALAFVLAAPAAVQAKGFCCRCEPKPTDQYGFRKTFAPRAAPWYVYWPYPAYFTYPAPTGVNFGPDHMSPQGFNPNMFQQGQYMPYPTNGFGQSQ